MADFDDMLIWRVRTFIYQQFALTARAPTVEEAAHHFGLTLGDAASTYRELHRRHALFLEPGTNQIRMASPFSAVPTSFRVHAEGRDYWANCAWDSLGIPAALHKDATIEANDGETGQVVILGVTGGQVAGHGERVHFALPFRRWYDDLVFT